MESKLGIFVVIAVLAQSCFVASTDLRTISDEDMAVFGRILGYQEGTVGSAFAAFNPVYDVTQSMAAKLVWNQTCGIADTSSIVQNALAQAKDAIVDSIAAIVLGVGGEYCSAAETARDESYADLDDLFALVPQMMELATTAASFDEYKTQSVDLRTAQRTALSNLVSSVFGSIATCLEESSSVDVDEDTLATIQFAAAGSNASLRHTIDALINAIDLYATAVSAGSADLSLLSAIRYQQSYSLVGLRADVEHKFSLIKTLFLKDKLNLDILTSDFYAITYAQTVLAYRLKSAAIINAGVATNYFDEANIGLTADLGTAVLSEIDAAKVQATEYCVAGLRAIAGAVGTINPDAANATAAVLETLIDFAQQGTENVYATIGVVLDATDLSYALATIEEQKAENLAQFSDFVDKIIELVLNGKTFDDDAVNEFVAYVEEVKINAIKEFSANLWDIISVIAEAKFTTEDVSDDYYSAVEALQVAANSAVDTFAEGVANLAILVVLYGP